MLSRFFLSGKKEISNETSINVEKVSERRLAIILQSCTSRNQTLAYFWPCHTYFSRAHAKLYTITPLRLLTWSISQALHPWAQQHDCTPWKCWICHEHTIQQLYPLPAGQLLSNRVAVVHKGGGWHGPLEERVPGISPRLDEFPWGAVQGLFALCSASLPENID